MFRKNGKWLAVAFMVIALLALTAAGALAQENGNGTVEPEVSFTFNGLGNWAEEFINPGVISFSITTKVVDNGAIDPDTPLRYKAQVFKYREPWGWWPVQNQTISYGEGFAYTFSTDEEGVAWFGPGTGFTLSLLPGLLDEGGVTTALQTELGPGAYYIVISLVDLSTDETLGQGDHGFVVYWESMDIEYDLTGLEDGTPAGDCSFSITYTANYEEELDEIPVCFWLCLIKDDEWQEDHEFQFADGNNWVDFQSEELFGPKAGLTLGDLKEGLTVDFRTTLEPGNYELLVDVFDTENSIYLGEASFTFTIVEPTPPEEPEEEP